jgi:hypothetical protein
MAAGLAAGVLGVALLLELSMGGGRGVVAITLPAVMVRGDGVTPTVPTTDATRTVELRLEAGVVSACPGGRAVVGTVEGAEVWRGAVTGDRPGLVAVVHVPAERLAAGGDFVVHLHCGQAPDAPPQRYWFRVSRPS